MFSNMINNKILPKWGWDIFSKDLYNSILLLIHTVPVLQPPLSAKLKPQGCMAVLTINAEPGFYKNVEYEM